MKERERDNERGGGRGERLSPPRLEGVSVKE